MRNLIRRVATRAFVVAVVLSDLVVVSLEDSHAQQSVADFYRGKQMKFIIRSEPGGGYDIYSRLIGSHNNVLGTKFKMINGYRGANDVRLAMERGEVEGYEANPWNS